jgi:hypothetical protein
VAEAERDRALLAQASLRAAGRPFFLAGALAVFRALRGMTDEQLATFLGCAPGVLSELGLCRRPDPTASTFRADVERVAAYVGAASEQLARLLREVDSVAALRRAPAATADRGALLAARDRLDGTARADERRDDDPSAGTSVP